MSMRFEVPQFVDIQDKIFGPFTLPQFIFMAGGGGLAYVIFRLVPTFIKWPLAAIPLVFGLALAFYKVNGRPFSVMVQAFFKYIGSTKLYLWRHRLPEKVTPPQPSSPHTTRTQADDTKQHLTDDTILTDRELHDLAWNLDIMNQSRDPQS